MGTENGVLLCACPPAPPDVVLFVMNELGNEPLPCDALVRLATAPGTPATDLLRPL